MASLQVPRGIGTRGEADERTVSVPIHAISAASVTRTSAMEKLVLNLNVDRRDRHTVRRPRAVACSRSTIGDKTDGAGLCRSRWTKHTRRSWPRWRRGRAMMRSLNPGESFIGHDERSLHGLMPRATPPSLHSLGGGRWGQCFEASGDSVTVDAKSATDGEVKVTVTADGGDGRCPRSSLVRPCRKRRRNYVPRDGG